MPLSEYEQRVLEQMERQLRSDDPKLASTLHGRRHRPGRLVLAVGAGLVGLGLLITGAAASIPVLGVIGFVVMFGAVLLGLSGPRKAGPAAAPGHPVRGRAAKAGFLTRLEERWERRRGEQR